MRLIALWMLGLVPAAWGTSVIVDTDAGSDDMMAIAYLMAHKDVKIEAIVVANGLAHVDAGGRNLLRLCALAGRNDVPVYIGSGKSVSGNREFPADWRKQSDDLGSGLPATSRVVEKKTAAAFYKERLAKASPELKILALGPLTNFQESAGLLKNIGELVIMGGAVGVPGNLGDGDALKTKNTTAEWNIYVDPEAAERVFRSGAKIRLVPLDATNQVKIDKAFLDSFRAGKRNPLGGYVDQVLESDRKHIEGGYFYAWDPLAAVALLHPDVAKFEAMPVSVKQKAPEDGRTVRGTGVGGNTSVAMNADAGKFYGYFRKALIQ